MGVFPRTPAALNPPQLSADDLYVVGQAQTIPSRLIAPLALAVCLALPALCHAAAYTDPMAGCSFDVPDDWAALPQSTTDDFLSQLALPGAPAFIAGFQPRSHKGLTYPYMIVQTMHYPGSARFESISEEDLQQLTAQLGGVNPGELHKALSLDTADFRLGDDGGRGTYFTDPPSFRLNLTQRTPTGPVQELIYGLVGKDRLVSMMIYSVDDDEGDPDFAQMMGSFHLSPAEQAPLRDSFINRIFERASMGAVAVGIGGLLCLLFFRGRQAEE